MQTGPARASRTPTRTFRYAPLTRPLVETRWKIAAALAVLALAGFVARAGRSPADAAPPVTPGDYADLLSDAHAGGLPAGLTRAWPVDSSARGFPSPRARAVRIGARIVDLERVAQARDRVSWAAYYAHDSAAMAASVRYSARVAALARGLATDLDNVHQGAPAAALYRAIEQEGEDIATVDGQTLRLARASALAFHPRLLALGNWLEAARVAALRGDRAFLERPECQAEADEAMSLPDVSRAGRASLARVRDLLPTASYGDLRPLEQALTAALRTLAT